MICCSGYFVFFIWALNSVGRVTPLHGVSHRFESCSAHVKKIVIKNFKRATGLKPGLNCTSGVWRSALHMPLGTSTASHPVAPIFFSSLFSLFYHRFFLHAPLLHNLLDWHCIFFFFKLRIPIDRIQSQNRIKKCRAQNSNGWARAVGEHH